MTDRARLLTAKAVLARMTSEQVMDRDIANSREAALETNESEARIVEKLRAVRDKKKFVPPRNDMLADRDIFEELQWSLRNGFTLRLSARKPPLVRGIGDPFRTTQLKRLLDAERDR
jgi:hypothetical protein